METHEMYDATMEVDASTWQLFQHVLGVDTYINTTCARCMTTYILESQLDANRPTVPQAPHLLTPPCRKNFTKVFLSISEIIIEFLKHQAYLLIK